MSNATINQDTAKRLSCLYAEAEKYWKLIAKAKHMRDTGVADLRQLEIYHSTGQCDGRKLTQQEIGDIDRSYLDFMLQAVVSFAEAKFFATQSEIKSMGGDVETFRKPYTGSLK
jgi:hypothetical protein